MKCPMCGFDGSHTPGCPYKPAPAPVHRCQLCGYGIYEGFKYKDFGDGPVCESCLTDMSAQQIMELCGEHIQVAHKE